MILSKEIHFLQRLIGILIKRGKKEKALKIVLTVIKNLRFSIPEELKDKDMFSTALTNITPILNIIKVKRGSRTFYKPRIINTEQRIGLAMQWLSKSIRGRKEKALVTRVTLEIIDCVVEKGLTITRKKGLYDTVLANRPFLNMLLRKQKKTRKQ